MIGAYKMRLREVRREMRARGVRRISSMNGGLSTDERRYNNEVFFLETEIERLQKIQAEIDDEDRV